MPHYTSIPLNQPRVSQSHAEDSQPNEYIGRRSLAGPPLVRPSVGINRSNNNPQWRGRGGRGRSQSGRGGEPSGRGWGPPMHTTGARWGRGLRGGSRDDANMKQPSPERRRDSGWGARAARRGRGLGVGHAVKGGGRRGSGNESRNERINSRSGGVSQDAGFNTVCYRSFCWSGCLTVDVLGQR